MKLWWVAFVLLIGGVLWIYDSYSYDSDLEANFIRETGRKWSDNEAH